MFCFFIHYTLTVRDCMSTRCYHCVPLLYYTSASGTVVGREEGYKHTTDKVKFMYQPAAQSGSCVNLLCEKNLPWGR